MLESEFGFPVEPYWCSLCGELHKPTPNSEEQIMRTGWRAIDNKAYNVGFCNGLYKPAHQLRVRPQPPKMTTSEGE